MKTERLAVLKQQDGVAMLTVLMLTIILTVIGIAAITSTTMDVKMAGGERLRESGVNAAESCLNTGIQIIQQTLTGGIIPAGLLGSSANPSIPKLIRLGGTNPLEAEIMGQSDGNPDSANPQGGSPNAQLTTAGYTVTMDIDRLYAKAKAGSGLQFAAGYSGTGGGAAGGGVEVLYRIDCYATNTGGTASSSAHLTGVYACVVTGQSCQRQI